MSTFTPTQRQQFLEKARARKAQAESKVDVLAQLEIGEGDKKKRKGSEVRLNIPVKKPSLSAPVADKATAAGEGTHVKSPAKKRSKSLVKKNRNDANTLGVDKD
jgi:hypothetical protein